MREARRPPEEVAVWFRYPGVHRLLIGSLRFISRPYSNMGARLWFYPTGLVNAVEHGEARVQRNWLALLGVPEAPHSLLEFRRLYLQDFQDGEGLFKGG